jgi:hypothetical protein
MCCACPPLAELPDAIRSSSRVDSNSLVLFVGPTFALSRSAFLLSSECAVGSSALLAGRGFVPFKRLNRDVAHRSAPRRRPFHPGSGSAAGEIVKGHQTLRSVAGKK